MARIPQVMMTHKLINKLLMEYHDDPTVFATEREYFLALYAKEMWQRLNALKVWTDRYRLNTESLRAFHKKVMAQKKGDRPDYNQFDKFMHKRILMLDETELGRREIMDIE